MPIHTTLTDAFAYIESFTNFEKKPFPLRFFRLDRMQKLLDLVGNPQEAFRSYHIAGSKGKGSTAIFLASILKEAGFRTGLYTSPHLVSYKERITLAGDEIDDEVFLEQIALIQDRLSRLRPEEFPGGEYPTTFELLTCLGFLVFRQLECNIAVLETGMGGRLDATNVVLPIASILTPIELEHTEYLGDTIQQIASEKAGIIKPNTPVIVSPQVSEALDVFRLVAESRTSPLYYLPHYIRSFEAHTHKEGTELRLEWNVDLLPPPLSPPPLRLLLRLLGEVQAENAALAALTTYLTMPHLSGEIVERGLSTAYLPGRFQRIQDSPPVYVDGSHTPLSAHRLLHSFLEIHPHPHTLILGIVSGKRYEEIASILCPSFQRVIVTTPGTFKQSDPVALAECCRRFNPSTILIQDPKDALNTALTTLPYPEAPILVTGSFYLAGEILKAGL
ncbi:MAG: bifunctional folylpolyglutamate synthase/dihydrofolate synthase [Spirochaetes bacterium]|nr:bifunctional folylpolyglutamate synthase/dihydrofolate synthase [Spirochaetota bacterium]